MSSDHTSENVLEHFQSAPVPIHLVGPAGDILTATGAEPAVSAFARPAPVVVLSGVGLADTDEYGLIRQLHGRAAPGGSAVIRVTLTAWARTEDRGVAREAGFQAGVVKPIDPVQLVARLSTLVQERRLVEIGGTRIARS